ncbi:MAG: phosphotransferase, partial [Chloroflexi bacterium]|nr:phosphotransferase [Chloroflexota bacterium]
MAARLTVDDGRRLFVKAAGPEPNTATPKAHKSEINIVTALPRAAPVPRLLWSHDEGEGGWVVRAFEDVDGHHPIRPWRTDERDRVAA